MASLPLRPEVFTILRALIEERLGLSYAYADRELLADKLSMRALESGFDSLLDYYYFLRYDPGATEELERLVDSLVVGETYFFREYSQLSTLVNEYIVPLAASGTKPRIWCTACASGEEPMTLAIMLAEVGLLSESTIVASDISERMLTRARRGEHGVRALRTVPSGGVAERWLERGPEGRVRANSLIREAIEWRKVNLIDQAKVREQGSFHIILCKNVLIYFSDETTARVLMGLRDQLEPGGVLVVGVSESLMRFGSAFVCEERNGAFFYRKPP